MVFTFPENSITEAQFESIKSSVRNNIYGIIEVVKKNIQSENERAIPDSKYNPNPNIIYICAGLYTYAVEEFGKHKLLESCQVNGGLVDLSPIRKSFFNHDKKFELAREALPPECFTLYDSEPDDAMWNLVINDLAYPAGWVSDTTADFATRLDLFNVGIENNGQVRATPEINFYDLQHAVERLENEFLSLDHTEN